MRKCTKCNNQKNEDDFRKTKSGFISACRVCENIMSKAYQKTEKGLIAAAYSHQKYRSYRRKHPIPTYTLFELREWVFSQSNFKKLFDNWVNSGYQKKIYPSIDRIDDSMGYSLDNIQLITWEMNNTKGYKCMREGKVIQTANPQKPVMQYTKDGKFIAEYVSQAQASRETGVMQSHISLVCRGKRKSSGGYAWFFKDML